MSTRFIKKGPRSAAGFAICVNNAMYPASLELHKIYRLVTDPSARERGDLRVIDESGEDYLYPAEWFIPIDVPPQIRVKLIRGRGRAGQRKLRRR